MVYEIGQRGKFWKVYDEEGRIVQGNLKSEEEAKDWVTYLEDQDRREAEWEPEPDERDEDYEREAARAHMNDFEDTGGKDWT
jgi:hypothetical protein